MKTKNSITYLMRHGYKQLEGAASVKADMKTGDINGIHIDKTMNALEKGILADMNDNPLTRIITSSRLRSDSTGELLKRMYEETHDNKVQLYKDYVFSDLVLLSEHEAGDNPYLNNPIIGYLSLDDSVCQFKSFFDDKMTGWAIAKANDGVNEWDRLKMFFMSDPYMKGEKPIPEEYFGSSMPAYEIGERGFSSLSLLVGRKMSQDCPESSTTVEKPSNIAVISHSAIIEPIIAYAQLDAEMPDSTGKSDARRDLFYEILDDFAKNTVGNEQWGFTEYAKIGWKDVSKMEQVSQIKTDTIKGFRRMDYVSK